MAPEESVTVPSIVPDAVWPNAKPPANVIINIEKYGNTSGGTIPLAMETAVEEGKLKKGDLVLLAAAGAGFTVGAALLRWEI